jgi:hypothetical protein
MPKQAVMARTAMADVRLTNPSCYMAPLSQKETTNARMIRPWTASRTDILRVEMAFCYERGVL